MNNNNNKNKNKCKNKKKKKHKNIWLSAKMLEQLFCSFGKKKKISTCRIR